MSQTAISVAGLGKLFRSGGAHHSRGMHETIERFARNPIKHLKSIREDRCRWALRDVSFEVKRGQAVAILGSNGAGKSVLLKILSRVTAPTEGSAELHGHVGSLLEVGAGFHPELSGRENVYFNGAILGMNRSQILNKFDEIVEFSEVGAFIDIPVKLYSSGMRMRLAFSVAVHLEPDILLIDEALAVGDVAFREKCRKKVAHFVTHGCTLLVVSHDSTIIEELCDRAILLVGGRMTDEGAAGDLLSRYLTSK